MVALSRQEKIDFFNERISASIGAMTLIVDVETELKTTYAYKYLLENCY